MEGKKESHCDHVIEVFLRINPVTIYNAVKIHSLLSLKLYYYRFNDVIKEESCDLTMNKMKDQYELSYNSDLLTSINTRKIFFL